ncbi:uncharacterized protein LOC101236338 [Hydra vulgaris]|uniref:uncharacterized protein LOC101236338 n=1 Tax=Hydra vulgaris TaxID=6087 RepID=UPI001F5FCF54|nr:uncharacterized protein LOC101236338 [Hydra vulgaris]XP_047122389.1 uncharacterized protein LOC101236338 [Hydra vulgaris]
MAESDIYFCSEDLDFMFLDIDQDLLDNDIEVDLNEALNEVTTSAAFSCQKCKKCYKTKGGLTRHIRTKHSDGKPDTIEAENFLSVETIKTLVNESINTLLSEKYYPDIILNKISQYINVINDLLYQQCNKIYKKLVKTGNGENFYMETYSSLVLESDKYFNDLKKPCSTLISTALTDKILYYYKTSFSENKSIELKPISAKELDGLQYLAGYILSKFLKKAKNSKHYQSEETQAITSILNHCVLEKNLSHGQRLIDVQNRGGLISLTEECQQIFILTEIKFRSETLNSMLRKVDIANMAFELITNTTVQSFYNAIVENSCQFKIDKEVKTNLLESMVKLYLRVRSFSMAKDVVQRQKAMSKKTKSKSGLRSNIKKGSDKTTIKK